MDKVSICSEFEVDRLRYQDIVSQFEKIGSPPASTLQLEDLRDTFDWERSRFVQIDGYVQQGFNLHARMFESMKQLAEGRVKSSDIRVAQLRGHLQQLEQIQDKVAELIQNNPPEEKKEAAFEDAFEEDQKVDMVTIAANKILKIRSLKQKAKALRDERETHVNFVLTPTVLKNICKEGAGKKKGPESLEEEMIKNILQIVHRRVITDKAEVKRLQKDIGYMRAVMMRLNPDRVPYDVIKDVEGVIEKAKGEEREMIKLMLPFFQQLVAEYKQLRDIKEATSSLYRIKAEKNQDVSQPRYNLDKLEMLRGKVQENIEFLENAIDTMKNVKMEGNDDVQKLEVDFRGLRENEFALKQEHDQAQSELKKPPRERSLSKVPINDRPSVIQEGEVEGIPGPIIEIDGSSKSKGGTGFFACCGFT